MAMKASRDTSLSPTRATGPSAMGPSASREPALVPGFAALSAALVSAPSSATLRDLAGGWLQPTALAPTTRARPRRRRRRGDARRRGVASFMGPRVRLARERGLQPGPGATRANIQPSPVVPYPRTGGLRRPERRPAAHTRGLRALDPRSRLHGRSCRRACGTTSPRVDLAPGPGIPGRLAPPTCQPMLRRRARPGPDSWPPA